MENQNRELADENSCLHEEIEQLRIILDQYLSESSASAKVSVIEHNDCSFVTLRFTNISSF